MIFRQVWRPGSTSTSKNWLIISTQYALLLVLKNPVMYGIHMQNFKEIARLVRAAHAGLQVKNADDLYRQMRILIENPDEAIRIGENGHHLLEQNRGATQRTLEVIDRRMLSR